MWELNAPTGTPGTNWDYLNLDGGALTFTGTSFTVDITSLTPGNSPGLVSGMTYPAGPFSFEIASADSITGFAPGYFSLLTGNFQNTGYVWSIYQSPSAFVGGNEAIWLLATPGVPEPSIALLLGLGGLMLLRRRKM